MSTRNGKIAKLGYEQRELVNRWLAQNWSTPLLLEHLNGLPEVKEMLDREFGGEPINKHNVSAWRRGGHREWETRQEWLADVKSMKEFAAEVLRDGSESLVERMTVALAGRYASLMMRWNGEADEATEKKIRVLGRLSRDVLALQRGQQRQERLKLTKAAQQAAELKMLMEQKRVIEDREAEEAGVPVMKEMMGLFGVDFDELKARAEEKMAGEEDDEETSNIEHPTSNAEGGNEETEVVGDEGASRSVAVSSGEEEVRKAGGEKREDGGLRVEDGGERPNVEGKETLNPEPRTLNVEGEESGTRVTRPSEEKGGAQWN